MKYFAMLLLFFSFKAFAGEHPAIKHMEGKQLVYVGTCWFDQSGVLTFSKEKRKTVFKCAVGMALPDETKHYVLVYINDKPARLVMYDEKTKKQVTLWSEKSM